MYSGQAVDTSFPGGPSGQHTIPSHSGEQNPSAETMAMLTFKRIIVHFLCSANEKGWRQVLRVGLPDIHLQKYSILKYVKTML